MDYTISLTPIPQWLRYDLAKIIKEKIEKEKLEAKITNLDVNNIKHGDLPTELIINGAAVALLMPFIQDWLLKRRIDIEYKNVNGKVTIIIKGTDPNRIRNAKEMILDKDKK